MIAYACNVSQLLTININTKSVSFSCFLVVLLFYVFQNSSNGICQNLATLVGGFETKTGEQVCYVKLFLKTLLIQSVY